MEQIPTPIGPNHNFRAIRLLVLSNLFTAAVVGSFVYFGFSPQFNPSSEAEHLEKVLEENQRIRSELSKKPPEIPPAQTPDNKEFEPVKVLKLDLSIPEYISWTENKATFDITGFEYGRYVIKKLPPVYDSSSYTVGQEVNAISLKLRIRSSNSVTDCLSLPGVRRVSKSEDIFPPNNRQLYFASGGCYIQPFVTYTDKELNFILNTNDTELSFIYPYNNQLATFRVSIDQDQIKVQR